MLYGPNLVINIAGLNGTGKSTLIGDVFGEDWTVFRCSDVLRQNAGRLGIGLTKPEEYPTVHSLLEAENPNFMTDAILELKGKVVVDGLRVYSHAAKLQSFLGEKYLTTLLSLPDNLRLQRLQARTDRGYAPQSIDDLHRYDASSMPESYHFSEIQNMRNSPAMPFDMSGLRIENATHYGMIVRQLPSIK